MMLPNKPKRGDDVTEWASRVVDCLRAMRITSFVGGRVKESTSGTTLVANAKGKAEDGEKGESATLITNADESGARVLIDTDPEGEVASEYVLRRIVADEVDSGQPTVTVEEEAGTIVIGLENIPSADDYPPGGLSDKHLDLVIQKWAIYVADETDGGAMRAPGSYEVDAVLKWRYGIYVGEFSSTEPLEGDEGLTISEKIVTRLDMTFESEEE
jgi:hypothetical protein